MVNRLVYHLSFYFGIVEFLYTKIMSKETYKKIFDEAYENYASSYTQTLTNFTSKRLLEDNPNWKPHLLPKEGFIVKVRADEEFAKEWGLVFESRDLTREELCEREPKLNEIYDRKLEVIKSQKYEQAAKIRDEEKKILETLPSRVITLAYKDETIEVYE
jgi:hypothetical protein